MKNKFPRASPRHARLLLHVSFNTINIFIQLVILLIQFYFFVLLSEKKKKKEISYLIDCILHLLFQIILCQLFSLFFRIIPYLASIPEHETHSKTRIGEHARTHIPLGEKLQQKF